MADEVKVTINGQEIVTTTDALARAFCERKARPESIWFSNNVKYIERGLVKGPSATYEQVYIVVTEQLPCCRTISYQQNFDHSSDYSDAGYKQVRLSFPYIVNVFVFKVGSDGTISLDRSWPLSFYRTLPLSGFSDELLICNVPNVRIDPWNDSAAKAAIGWTCYHNAGSQITSIKPVPKKGNMTGESDLAAVSRLADKCLSYFWEASFTGSAGAITAWLETAKKVPGVSSIEEWAKNSATNANFALSVEWLPHPEKAKLADVVLSIREALTILPHEGFDNGEDSVIAPNNEVSAKRLLAIIQNSPNVSKKLKYY